MKTITLLFILSTCLPFLTQAQMVGDYRSAASGNWGTNSTWELFDGAMWVPAGAAPTSANGTITIRNPHTVIANTSVSGDQLIVESGGNFSITSTFTLNDGPGDDILINGTMNFNSGTLSGAGSITIAMAAAFTFSSAGVKSIDSGVTITNEGTMNWEEGGLNASGAVINNNIFEISASALWQFSGGLTNTGTINKTAGTTTISTPWSNSGTINFSGGSLTSSAVFTNTGAIHFTAGAAWLNNSTFNHNVGSVIDGTGSFNNNSTLALAVDQIFPATLIFSSGGGNTINGPGALTINNDFVIQGTITGGPMILNGNGEWSGGTLGRSLTVDVGRTLLLTTSGVKTLDMGSTLTNNGTLSWEAGGINGAGAIINNNIFNIEASALWQFSGGLTNTGTINKTAGTTTISTPWNNSGTINLSGGTLTSSGVFTNTGMILFSSGAAWQNNSTFNHNVGSVIDGTGSFNNNSTLGLAVDQIFPATLIFSSGGGNTINGPGALTINNDFVIQGTITGGPLVLNGNGEWSDGTLGRSLTVDVGRTLLLTTSGVKTLDMGSTLTNNGTLSWEAGGINGAGAIINNNIFNIEASALWQFSGGLTNTGTINKTAGTTIISTPWSNSGTINFSGGSLTSSAAFTNTGPIHFTAGATWQNNSTFNHNVGSVIDGTGSFNNNSTLALAVDQIFPATLIFSSGMGNIINGPGALTINNDFVIQGTITGGPLVLNGNGEWSDGTLGRSLTVDVGRTLLLTTSGVKTLDMGSTLTNNGTLSWEAGGINASGAIINNNIFDIEANALWQFSGGLTNNGVITKTSTGTTTIGTPVTNTATGIIKGIGTFTFSSTFINDGTIAPGLSPGILTMNGTQPLTAFGTLEMELMDGTGAGTGHDQLVRNGNLILTGTLTVVETGTVPDGLYTIVELTSGVLSGTFSTVNLPPGYTLQINPSTVVLEKEDPLSLTLVSFTARKTTDQKVDLQWVTTDEQNVSHFEIQRSSDGLQFTTIGQVPARNDNAAGSYLFRDEAPMATSNLYRLQMVDLDSTSTFSPIRTVRFSHEDRVFIYPMLTKDKVFVDAEEPVRIQLFSMSGVMLQQKTIVGHDFLDVSLLPNAMYIITLGEGGKSVKIIKQ